LKSGRQELFAKAATLEAELTKPEIIKTIRSLHRQGKPLNISAVKRRHPELMKAVYAIKPYWGWKRAPEAAGVKYSDIKLELQDYCECEICHAQKERLNVHIKFKHGVEMEDYRIDYPEADVICEEIRARFSKMKCKDLPHWEPLWTAEYALDRLWDRRDKGLPINSKAFQFRDPGLLRHIRPLFGSLDNAFRSLGLNPDDIRRNRISLKNKEEVLNGITKRLRLNLPLNPRAVLTGMDSNCALNRGAIRFFGSWSKAIEAAGLDYDAFLRKSRYPSPEKVIHEIRRRHEKKLSLITREVRRGNNRDHALYDKTLEFFGSWKKALSAAKIRYKDIAPCRLKYPTKESVITEIRRRKKAGLSISSSDVHLGMHTNTALYNSGLRFFKKWATAVKSAGFSYRAIGSNRRRGMNQELNRR